MGDETGGEAGNECATAYRHLNRLRGAGGRKVFQVGVAIDHPIAGLVHWVLQTWRRPFVPILEESRVVDEALGETVGGF